MAEFLGQERPEKIDGFNAFGSPVPASARINADKHLIDMGVTDASDRFSCIQAMSDAIERDDPYRAMSEGMRFLDLTGTYRLMAVLCCPPHR